MLQRALLLCVILLISSIACVDAFPLSGGNGIVNATVYGVTERETVNGDGTIYCIDMSADAGSKDSGYCYFVVLIDSEDRAYGPSPSSGAMANFNGGNARLSDLASNGYKFRDTVKIAVPEGTIIKRLKITPDEAVPKSIITEPFTIDWDGVPEVSAQGIKLQLYSGQPEYASDGKYSWVFDVKVTNLGNGTVTAPGFSMLDDSGWIYKGSSPRDKLLPGEALRFDVVVKDVGAFSRPSELIFNMKPPVTFDNAEELQSKTYEDASMDIGAWV
ncbi:hypothetical protein [Methanothrix soehngenii]|jgi:hypothetical protein|uniref:hypothetical protein n=1 Tax=Methanothrix soehngenii TaxID=2223 RepID=UPI000E7F1679|nr:hypothetical protein [Euryarchaeota archaeon]HBG01814.1 hypothetical protein [Bacillota bacterium]